MHLLGTPLQKTHTSCTVALSCINAQKCCLGCCLLSWSTPRGSPRGLQVRCIMLGGLELQGIVPRFKAEQRAQQLLLKRDTDLRRRGPGNLQGLRIGANFPASRGHQAPASGEQPASIQGEAQAGPVPPELDAGLHLRPQ